MPQDKKAPKKTGYEGPPVPAYHGNEAEVLSHEQAEDRGTFLSNRAEEGWRSHLDFAARNHTQPVPKFFLQTSRDAADFHRAADDRPGRNSPGGDIKLPGGDVLLPRKAMLHQMKDK